MTTTDKQRIIDVLVWRARNLDLAIAEAAASGPTNEDWERIKAAWREWTIAVYGLNGLLDAEARPRHPHPESQPEEVV